MYWRDYHLCLVSHEGDRVTQPDSPDKSAPTDPMERMMEAADELVANDGHAHGCAFRGCTCGRVEGYKAARTDFFRAKRELIDALNNRAKEIESQEPGFGWSFAARELRRVAARASERKDEIRHD